MSGPQDTLNQITETVQTKAREAVGSIQGMVRPEPKTASEQLSETASQVFDYVREALQSGVKMAGDAFEASKDYVARNFQGNNTNNRGR